MLNSYTNRDNITISVKDQIHGPDKIYFIMDLFDLFDGLYIVYRDCSQDLNNEPSTKVERVDRFFDNFKNYLHTITPYQPTEQEIQTFSVATTQGTCCSTLHRI